MPVSCMGGGWLIIRNKSPGAFWGVQFVETALYRWLGNNLTLLKTYQGLFVSLCTVPSRDDIVLEW